MDPKLFWQLLEDICQLGDFVTGIEAKGAEINLVGTFQVAFDGHEQVLEKRGCGDHFHLAPEKIRAIHFGYHEVATGGEDPSIELINVDGEACLILMYYPYQRAELEPKCREFMEEHEAHKDLLTGKW